MKEKTGDTKQTNGLPVSLLLCLFSSAFLQALSTIMGMNFFSFWDGFFFSSVLFFSEASEVPFQLQTPIQSQVDTCLVRA